MSAGSQQRAGAARTTAAAATDVVGGSGHSAFSTPSASPVGTPVAQYSTFVVPPTSTSSTMSAGGPHSHSHSHAHSHSHHVHTYASGSHSASTTPTAAGHSASVTASSSANGATAPASAPHHIGTAKSALKPDDPDARQLNECARVLSAADAQTVPWIVVTASDFKIVQTGEGIAPLRSAIIDLPKQPASYFAILKKTLWNHSICILQYNSAQQQFTGAAGSGTGAPAAAAAITNSSSPTLTSSATGVVSSAAGVTATGAPPALTAAAPTASATGSGAGQTVVPTAVKPGVDATGSSAGAASTGSNTPPPVINGPAVALTPEQRLVQRARQKLELIFEKSWTIELKEPQLLSQPFLSEAVAKLTYKSQGSAVVAGPTKKRNPSISAQPGAHSVGVHQHPGGSMTLGPNSAVAMAVQQHLQHTQSSGGGSSGAGGAGGVHAMSLPSAVNLADLAEQFRIADATGTAPHSAGPHSRSDSWSVPTGAWGLLTLPPPRGRQPSLPRSNKFELDLNRHRDTMLSVYDSLSKHKGERTADWMVIGTDEKASTAHGTSAAVLHQGKGSVEDMRAFFPRNRVSFGILRTQMGRTFKTVAISYYPAQTSTYKWTDQDRGLMLAALKLLALFPGLATTLQVDELDKLTNAFVKEALQRVVDTNTIMLRVNVVNARMEPDRWERIWLDRECTVKDLKDACAETFQIPTDKQRITNFTAQFANAYGEVVTRFTELSELQQKIVPSYGLFSGDKLYLLQDAQFSGFSERFLNNNVQAAAALAIERMSELEKSIESYTREKQLSLSQKKAKGQSGLPKISEGAERQRDAAATAVGSGLGAGTAAAVTVTAPNHVPGKLLASGTMEADKLSAHILANHAQPMAVLVAHAHATANAQKAASATAAAAAAAAASADAKHGPGAAAGDDTKHSAPAIVPAAVGADKDVKADAKQSAGANGATAAAAAGGAAAAAAGSGGGAFGDEKDPDDDESWEIDVNELLIVKEKVGRGKTAVVHKAIWRVAEVAYKELTYNRLTDAILKPFREEINILRKLRHRNIVMLVGACTRPEKLCIITEWVPRGSLRDVLLKREFQINFANVINMALDVAEGMSYLHSKRIIHRDLKSHNLLVDEQWTVKVADFGYAKPLERDQSAAHSEVGTSGWVAPEVLDDLESGYKKSVDVFSYAVCLWEMLVRGVPNPLAGLPTMKYYRAVQQNLMPAIPAWTPPAFAALIRECWSFDPVKRPDFDQIVKRLTQLKAKNVDGAYTKLIVASYTGS